MKGCERDTDGDGNCPLHPKGCPPPDFSDVNWNEDIKAAAVLMLEKLLEKIKNDQMRIANILQTRGHDRRPHPDPNLTAHRDQLRFDGHTQVTLDLVEEPGPWG